LTVNSLRRTFGRAAVWQVLAGGWQALVRLGASTILARTLAPSDFGLFGMALLITELVSYLGSLGMTGGVIAKKDAGDKELNTCFWTMAGVKVFLFVLAFAFAPLASVLMKEPRIEAIIRVVSWTFIISISSIVGSAILAKNLEYGKISIVNAVAIFLESSLAVYLAKTTNLGYWALVYPMLVSSLFINLSILIVSKWLPKFIFDKECFRFQFKFGIHGLGFNIANYLHQNLDYIIVGRLMGTNALGLYEYAYRIPHIILDGLARPVGGVVFPALAKVQDDDNALIKGYVETVRYVTLVAFPLLGGLAAIAEPLVLLLWGEKWRSIIVPLQILCLCAALRCCVQSIGAVFLCKHRPEIPFKQSVISCLATALFVSLGIWFFGLIGVALGMLFSTFSYIYAFILAFNITSTSPVTFFKVLVPSSVSTILSSLSAYLCNYILFDIYNPYIVVISSVLIGVVAYTGSYYFLFKNSLNNILQEMKFIRS